MGERLSGQSAKAFLLSPRLALQFHALRACFATQMLRNGIEAARVMKICGWKDLKTMQCYVRLAGIEIEGATEALRFFGSAMPRTPTPAIQPQNIISLVQALG